jgi:hypothetical protein
VKKFITVFTESLEFILTCTLWLWRWRKIFIGGLLIISYVYIIVLWRWQSRGCSVNKMTLLQAERPWFDFRQGQGNVFCLFTTMFRSALGPTQPPIQWVPGALSLGVTRPRLEADHSPPSTAEVKMRGAIAPFPHTSLWRGAWFNTITTWPSTLYWVSNSTANILSTAEVT